MTEEENAIPDLRKSKALSISSCLTHLLEFINKFSKKQKKTKKKQNKAKKTKQKKN